jgi:toxin YoeB
MYLQFSPEAWEDYREWERNDKAIYKRLNRLIDEIKRDPFEGIGKPEPLRHDLSGMWSRRIDEENRVLYFMKDNETVVLVRCAGHYD